MPHSFFSNAIIVKIFLHMHTIESFNFGNLISLFAKIKCYMVYCVPTLSSLIVSLLLGTCFFVNATKEWDRRKCIDNFNDFEKKVIALLLPLCNPPHYLMYMCTLSSLSLPPSLTL